ncbi:hypothetical protein [Nodularia sphaerocarpa]|uniref:hypothetical protein n=1 Tax=Nodularia sphaerocarpa TaxID=137816 RepID=UPI001EFA869D|nr:hypothetical protein [Nodularia sphaerocarpa]MDB9376008.1 hypothetical protein [Nodularia sphaerocarpa CS-585]MDB9379582.1 hypothetical protein [Nodularia sphaerocarpa CS-585A2]ULP72119.1 hypothetical protein BDGGKGIB_01757 [Nodularia sphaerocarpa UHCC 0038]
MFTQDYFKKRLGDIYEYSRIPYKCGEGKSDKNIEYFWELCIDASGSIIFILHTKEPIQHLDNELSFKKINSFSGISGDEIWEIECRNLHFLAETEKNCATYHRLSLFYLPNSITLKRKEQETKQLTLAKAYFSNFTFSAVDCECGFLVNINGKEVCFQMLENNKQLLNLIDMERINSAIISQVSIPINKDENIDCIQYEITSISWFLSLINLNLKFIPIVEYYADGEIVQYFIENTVKNYFNRNYVIDNFRINGGIPKAFNDSYEKYKALQRSMDINTCIGLLAEINQQKYIDIKLATMIMAYEYILFKYLLSQGLTQDQVGNNIQQKLRQVNKYLRFIPSQMMDDTLRDSVRNPLFHQGEIPLLTFNEKIDFFKKYYDLLIKIILRILSYTGEYMSIVTNSPSQS